MFLRGPNYVAAICMQLCGIRARAQPTGRRASKVLLSIASFMLIGCSVHPLPDDVMPIHTEHIILHARCEMRSAILDWIVGKNIVSPWAAEADIIAFVKATDAKVKRLQNINRAAAPNRPPIDIDKRLTEQERTIRKYMNVAVVYAFDFNITEDNKASGDVAFKLPFTPPAAFDLDAAASLHLTRQGQRQFKAGDRWAGMIVNSNRCTDVSPRRRNLVYPLDGSIGVGRVVETFINVSEQGGARDSFVDTLIFTTQVVAGTNAAVKLNAVPHQFRVVSASAHLNGSRIDVHKMMISLVFPHPDSPEAITGVERYDGDLNAPFDRPAPWRARYNLCVADAREREDTFKTLRYTAPEIYCIQYADAFAWQYGPPSPPGAGPPRVMSPTPRMRGLTPQRSLRPNY